MKQDRYEDPKDKGSLTAALQAWLGILANQLANEPHQLSFTLSCHGEARAARVASYLRRRIQCESTSVRCIRDGKRDEWLVEGATRMEVQSLTTVEQLFAWLSRSASQHQVELRGIAVRS